MTSQGLNSPRVGLSANCPVTVHADSKPTQTKPNLISTTKQWIFHMWRVDFWTSWHI